MPELPEIESLALSLRPLLVGQSIAKIRFLRDNLRYPIPKKAIQSILIGQKVTSVTRRSKYLILTTKKGSAIIHLGMSGRIIRHPSPKPIEAHTHFVLSVSTGECLHYVDPRRFGLFSTMEVSKALIERLGVEPLDSAHLDQIMSHAAEGSSQKIKVFLMNPGIVVGVGNIYASESLFLAGIHPERTAGSLSPKEWKKLAECTQKVLKGAIQYGGTTLRDYKTIDNLQANNQFHLHVYNQQICGQCHSTIQRKVIAQRSSYFCPICQPLTHKIRPSSAQLTKKKACLETQGALS